MKPLSKHELASLIGDISEGSQDPRSWGRALLAVCEHIGADAAVLVEIDQKTHAAEVLAEATWNRAC